MMIRRNDHKSPVQGLETRCWFASQSEHTRNDRKSPVQDLETRCWFTSQSEHHEKVQYEAWSHTAGLQCWKFARICKVEQRHAECVLLNSPKADPRQHQIPSHTA